MAKQEKYQTQGTTPSKSKPQAQLADTGKQTTSKSLAYTAWLKEGKPKDSEVLLKATQEKVKRSTCQSWLSFWTRGQNLPRNAAEIEAEIANAKPKFGKAKVKAKANKPKYKANAQADARAPQSPQVG